MAGLGRRAEGGWGTSLCARMRVGGGSVTGRGEGPTEAKRGAWVQLAACAGPARDRFSSEANLTPA